MSSKKISGIIMTVLSALGGFYAITTYSDDTTNLFGYNYEPPLTSHEITVIMIGVASAICLIVGLILLLGQDDSSSTGVQKVWICGTCGSANDISFAHCSNCGVAKTQIDDNPAIEKDWICNSCGTLNKRNVKTCQGCGVTKQWSESQQ